MAVENEAATGLEPQDWDAFEDQLHQIASDVVAHLKSLKEKPVWTRPTDAVREALRQPAPQEGIGIKGAYNEFQTHILPHITGNLHPKFLGWVVGSGAPASMVGDWLASFTNGAPTLFDDSCLLTELQTIDWLKELLKLDPKTSGILTTGASEATLISLTAARYSALGDALKQNGVFSLDKKPVFYLSDQTHDCSRKAIEILGFGRDHIRTIKTDDAFRMDCDALFRQLQADINDNKKPIAVIATLGTVNTGACDDIPLIADICKDLGVWFHIDAAFGAWASLAEGYHHLTRDFDRADSIVVDLHKWMFQSYDLGCALIRNPLVHQQSLSTSADYIAPIKGSLTDSKEHLSTRAIQLSRGFKALKLWFSLKSEGISAFAATIENNMALAGYFTDNIKNEHRLEMLAPTTLHIVNCRYVGGLEDCDEINQCNRDILRTLHETGFAIPSSTMLDGKFALRICITNHRTRQADLDSLIEKIIELGELLEVR